MRQKWLGGILAVFMVSFLLIVPVMAEGTVKVDKSSSKDDHILIPVESDKLGSITIRLEDTNGKCLKGGVTLAAVRVADVINGTFRLTEVFEKSRIDLNDIQTAQELETAARKLEKIVSTADIIAITDDTGTAMIENLTAGVYLIYAEDIADYEYIATSLVSIPTLNQDDGTMIHDIEVIPKHSALPESPKTNDSGKIWQYGTIAASTLLLVVGFAIRLRQKRIKP